MSDQADFDRTTVGKLLTDLQQSAEAKAARQALVNLAAADSLSQRNATGAALGALQNLFATDQQLAVNIAGDNMYSDNLARRNLGFTALVGMALSEDLEVPVFNRLTQYIVMQAHHIQPDIAANSDEPSGSTLFQAVRKAFLVTGDRELAEAGDDAEIRSELLNAAASVLVVKPLNFDVAAFLTNNGRATQPTEFTATTQPEPGKRPLHYGTSQTG